MKKYSISSILLILGSIAAVIVLFTGVRSDVYLYLAILALIVLLLFFYFMPVVGIYLMAATFPFTLFQIEYGSLNVPVVDVVGLLLFAVMLLKMLIEWRKGIRPFDKTLFPGIIYYSLFVIASALSIMNVQHEFFGDSVKYLLRPIIFIYLIYLLVPIYFIRSKAILLNVVKTMYWLGNLLALGGLWTMFIYNGQLAFNSAGPFGYGTFYPLGYNHNLLSEALISTFVLGIGLYWLEYDPARKNWYMFGAAIQAAVAFFTFSRAGWMAMMIQLLILGYLRYKDQMKLRLYKIWNWILISAVVPFLWLLYYLNSTDIAQGSNLNRLKLIQIAWSLFIEHPLVGAGIGTFFHSVEQVRWYIIEYGSALDAHGFFFKVLAETGSLGILAFTAFLLFIFYGIFTSYRRISSPELKTLVLVLFVSAIGGLVFQWFGTSYYIAKMWFPIGVTLAAVRIANEMRESAVKLK